MTPVKPKHKKAILFLCLSSSSSQPYNLICTPISNHTINTQTMPWI